MNTNQEKRKMDQVRIAELRLHEKHLRASGQLVGACLGECLDALEATQAELAALREIVRLLDEARERYAKHPPWSWWPEDGGRDRRATMPPVRDGGASGPPRLPGPRTMIHIIPCSDLIDHIEDADCPCGPEVDVEAGIVPPWIGGGGGRYSAGP